MAHTHHSHNPLKELVLSMWRSPLGILGVAITTVCATLMIIGVIADQLNAFSNPYAGIFIYIILPGGMITGLLMIPVAGYLERRHIKKGNEDQYLQINLANPKHRKLLVAFIVLTVINVLIFAVVAYEGYHFTDSATFCGEVCHTVMEPEFTAYQQSPHSRVACVECHIGPGATWFARAKISGLRQVFGVMTDDFSRPIPAPVGHFRPARDTCEQCHWPEKFHGKKIKSFKSFSNDNQKEPDITDIALHIGGRNPQTEQFEGIHWHVSKNVEVSYLSANDKRTEIATVKVKRPDGTTDEFVKEGVALSDEKLNSWRMMDCIDCHNRPTHIYDNPEERIDFGLLSHKINPDIPGIREDSLTVLKTEYPSRDAATEKLITDLLLLQTKRNPQLVEKMRREIVAAGQYVLDTYLENVWPKMNITWGTYKSHLGHQNSDEGYGCFRCHDGEHVSPATGKSISQDCGLCHDSPF